MRAMYYLGVSLAAFGMSLLLTMLSLVFGDRIYIPVSGLFLALFIFVSLVYSLSILNQREETTVV